MAAKSIEKMVKELASLKDGRVRQTFDEIVERLQRALPKDLYLECNDNKQIHEIRIWNGKCGSDYQAISLNDRGQIESRRMAQATAQGFLTELAAVYERDIGYRRHLLENLQTVLSALQGVPSGEEAEGEDT